MDEKVMRTDSTIAESIPHARGATSSLTEAKHDAAGAGSGDEEILELDLLEEFEEGHHDERVFATVVLNRPYEKG